MRLTQLVLPLLALAGLAAAQPRITGIQNNYSYLLPGAPNYGIAQGSIFVLYGTNMAPAGLLQQSFEPALSRNLGGVSIKTTVAGTTTEAIPYYVSPTQIAAILPSATPVGTGSMTVTYNGQTSPPFTLTVVRSAMGLLTLGGNGLGTAAVYDLDFNYINFTNSAHPGQVVTFWGTGQGPDPNDETRVIAAPQNLSNLPFEFYIANKPAKVLYHGRSTYPGLDQIVVEVPQDIDGCYASAYAKTGTVMSNFVSIPVAPSGKYCQDFFATKEESQSLLDTGKTGVRHGWFYVGRFTSLTPGFLGQSATTVIQDSATAQFLEHSPFHAANWGGVAWANPGCAAAAFYADKPFGAPIQKLLDGGPAVTLTIPDGTTRTLAKENVSNYSFSVNNATPGAQLFIPPSGGTFKFRAPGGTDVGVAEATVTGFPAMVWNQRTTTPAVSRAQDLTITWTGAAPNSWVLIQGVSTAGPNNQLIVTTFGCSAPAEAGRFTVPRDVLASMVPSNVVAPINLPMGQLIVANYTIPTRFTASGLDQGSATWFTWDSIVTQFQ
jgi:uncharacterized protein (TIGR03437 family)